MFVELNDNQNLIHLNVDSDGNVYSIDLRIDGEVIRIGLTADEDYILDTDFLKSWGILHKRLNDALDIEFQNEKTETALGRHLYNLGRALNCSLRGESRMADEHLARLDLFAKHLETVSQNKPKLYQDFLDELKEIEQQRYLGVRFEIDIAATLIRSDVEFVHPDPPDYVIEGDNNIKLECTTSHLTKKDGEFERKLKDSLLSKSGKDYMTSSTALLLDLTNIFHNTLPDNSGLIRQKIRDNVDTFDINVGSVIIFWHRVEEVDDTVRASHIYLREDIRHAEPELIDFLDKVWSKGEDDPNNAFSYPMLP